MSNPFAGLFGKETTARVNNPFSGLFPSPEAAAEKKQQDLLQQQEQAAQQPKGQSLFSKIKNVAIKVGKDVGEDTGKVARAVARPVIDVASGQGGKAVHDTAQLSSDVSGGVANDVANQAAKQVKRLAAPASTQAQRDQLIQNQTKAVTAVKTGKVSKETQALIDKGGQTAQGTLKTQKLIASGASDKQVQKQIIADQKAKADSDKRAAGAALSVASVLPAGEAVKAVTGAKDLLSAATRSGVEGAAGNEGATLEQNPEASQKELGKAGLVGLAAGVAAPVAGSLLGRAAKYVVDSKKTRITPEEAAQKLESSGYTPEESKVILSDALPEKGLSMPGSPTKIGLNDASVQKSAKNFDEAQTTKAAPQTTASETPEKVVTKSTEAAPSNVTEPAVVTTEGSNLKPLQSVEKSPEQGTSKLGTSVREKALQDKLISKTEAEAEDLPTYNKANMQQQAEYATSLVKKDPQHAIDIALGKAEPPSHILPQMVYNAVEEYARGVGGEDGAKLLLDLSRSKQVSNLTTMAQNVRAAGERDPHSPVNAINQVKVAREEAAKSRGKSVGKLAQKDAAAIRKATPKITKDDWTSFVDGLRC